MTDKKQDTQPDEQPDNGTEQGKPAAGDYHVSDLTGDQKPDPLGDAKLSPRERAGHND